MRLSQTALAFTRYVLQHNPRANSFETIYDAMVRAACSRSFENLSYQELASEGVSFSLLETRRLEVLLTEARKSPFMMM